MSIHKIFTEINGTMAELLQLISSFDREQINIIPF
jgi:hypothetical protein